MEQIEKEISESKHLVLIVDDVPRNLQALGSILYEDGCEIAMAESGIVALEMLEDISPDLILLDVMMPEIDGFETCKKIKADPKLADIPVIFLTAKTDSDDIVQGFRAGAVDYVAKPFNAEELISRVRTQIDLRDKTLALSRMNSVLDQKVKERTAELQKANEKLTKLDTAKNYFLSLISHELNTPINGITGYARLLQSDPAAADAGESVRIILQSAERLRKISETAQFVTQLRLDKYRMRLNPASAKEIFKSAMLSLSDRIMDKSIEIVSEFPEDDSVVADEFLAQKAVESIIDNAIKYSPAGSKIEVRCVSGDTFDFEIVDCGPGFPKKDKDEVFELFVSDEIMHHAEGLGLGLSTADAIMRLHSGKITAKNLNEGGASVRLRFKK